VEAPIQGWNIIYPLSVSSDMLITAACITIVGMTICLTEPVLWLPHFAPLVRR
jgi:hypothetical protein